MKVPVLTLLLLAALVITSSLTIPAEDDPDTPYDESEELPCEGTPAPRIEWLAHPAQSRQTALEPAPLFQWGFITKSEEVPSDKKEYQVPSTSDSLTILVHSFRC